MPRPPYGWPVTPFDKAHPVRGSFNDPRISGSSRAFHFGIDVSAPDGTPVYAVAPGKVHLEGKEAIGVLGSGNRSFGYWHVVPAVVHHQQVALHALLGHVAVGWAHVHLAERIDGEYVDPLRPGALTPWSDPTSPRIAEIVLYRAGTQQKLAAAAISGSCDLVCEAFDVPPLPVPAPWNDLPVTPGKIRWRIMRKTTVLRPWETPIDFTKTLIPKERFAEIYAPGTKQNHPGTPGRYRFFLAHAWSSRDVTDGPCRVEVEARDEWGNSATATLHLTVANEV
jgi:hypothetical protein